MSNATPSRLGQINGAGAVDALWLKVFAGEVLTAFQKKQIMMDKHMVRTISAGKSAQFPATGVASAEYHTPGNEILGNTINHNEVVITIDDLLIAHSFIANIDEAKNHYDVRSIYSTELGQALANQMDAHVLQTVALAARETTPNVTGGNAGKVIYTDDAALSGTPNFATSGSDLAAAIFLAAQTLDEKDVPEDNRYAVVKPQQYYNLVQSTDVINRDWGGKGAYAEGEVLRVAGINIVKANNLPTTNIANGTVGAGTGNKYAGDFTNLSALVFHKSAAGTVKLMDLGMESEYDIRRQGTLMVAKYAVGHGKLRPESAVEIRNATSV